MALIELPDLRAYLRVLPQVKQAPEASVWLPYDDEADVMYVNFRRPRIAIDSELRDDDVIVRYDAQNEIVGFTILHATQR